MTSTEVDVGLDPMRGSGRLGASVALGNACGGTVVALHCSGADGGQWRKLGERTGPAYRVVAPDLVAAVPCRMEFRLRDEAGPLIDLIDAQPRPVHLIGHSYGGGVALAIAAARPEKVASLVLYEPSAFHILSELDSAAAEATEIARLAAAVADAVAHGTLDRAAETFVDYWNGPRSWRTLKPEVRNRLAVWSPNAVRHFTALLAERTTLREYKAIGCPVLLLRGESSPAPSRRIVEELARYLPKAEVDVIVGAGHMGPITHAAVVNDRIVRHWAGGPAGCRTH